MNETYHRSNKISPNYDYVIQRGVSLGGGEGAKVLDFGCGRGYLVALARQRHLDFSGVDTYEGHYENWTDSLEEDATGHCKKIDNGEIPFDDNTFDAVVSNQVFEHVFEPEPALSEIHRVLKPGGKFLALFPTSDIWFEGHLGVYFVHWLKPKSQAQLNYLRTLRRLGFGYYKGKKSVDAWAVDRQKVLNEAVVYRPKHEIDQLWKDAFGTAPESEALDYMRFRLSQSRFRFLSALADVPIGRDALNFLCHKRAGRVLVTEKAAQV